MRQLGCCFGEEVGLDLFCTNKVRSLRFDRAYAPFQQITLPTLQVADSHQDEKNRQNRAGFGGSG